MASARRHVHAVLWVEMTALLCAVVLVLVTDRAVCAAVSTPSQASHPPPRLVQIQAVCRHGARSPRGTYPADPYRNLTWQRGFGTLVPSGVGGQVELGTSLRRRYGSALVQDSCRRISVIASDRNRTQESARALLHGLFLDTGLEGAEYQSGYLPPAAPICPIQVIPGREDFILIPIVTCPKIFAGVKAMLKQTPEYRDYVPLLRQIFAEHVGMPNPSFVDLVNVFDVLRTQAQRGLSLPAWTQEPLGEGLPTVYSALERIFVLSLGDLGAPTIRALSAGGLLRTMVNTARRPEIKFQLYAAHDTTLASLEAALGVYSGPLPTSSCLLLETFAAASGEKFVRLLRRNGGSGGLEEVPLGGQQLPLGGRDLSPLSKLEQLDWLPKSVDKVKEMCLL